MSRRALGPAVLARRAILAWSVSGLCVLAVAGCGGGESARVAEETTTAVLDPLQARAARIDSLLLYASGAVEADTLRERAYREIELLLRDVALEARPAEGWTAPTFRAAAGKFGLPLRWQTLDEFAEPALVLAHDARNLDVPPRAWLFYAQSGAAVRLPAEPFQQEFAPRAWRENGEAFLAILGWERARAGLQPKAWLFRLPSDASLSLWEEKTLPAVTEQFLSQGGAVSAEWLPATGAAPQLRVDGAARPNPLFEECGACPHLEADLVYAVALEHFVPQRETVRRTPYAAFVAFLEALMAGDVEATMALAASPVVVETAVQHGFNRLPARGRWRAAPGVSARQLDQTFFRGEDGVFRVLMSVRDSGFVVSSITPTEFLID